MPVSPEVIGGCSQALGVDSSPPGEAKSKAESVPGAGKSKAAKSRHKLAQLKLQSASTTQSPYLPGEDWCGVTSIPASHQTDSPYLPGEDRCGVASISASHQSSDAGGNVQPLAGQTLVLNAVDHAGAEEHTQNYAPERHNGNLPRFLWFGFSLILVLLGSRWGSEMGAMRRLEKLDAKVQHLQAQQEAAHCLPWQEDDPGEATFRHSPHPMSQNVAAAGTAVKATFRSSLATDLRSHEAAGADVISHTDRADYLARSLPRSLHNDSYAHGGLLTAQCPVDNRSLRGHQCFRNNFATGFGAALKCDASTSDVVLSGGARSSQQLPARVNEPEAAGLVEEEIAHVMWDMNRTGRLDVGLVWQAASVTMIGQLPGTQKNASWRLQWNSSCTSALVRGPAEERAMANLRHLVSSHMDPARERSDALWRLPWSRHIKVTTSITLALSASPLLDFEPSQLHMEQSHLVQPLFGRCGDTPFDMAAQSRVLHPASGAWRLSWVGSQSLMHHLFENMADAAGRATQEYLWRLPWTPMYPSEVGQLEPFNEHADVSQREERLHQRANWQLVWIHSTGM